MSTLPKHRRMFRLLLLTLSMLTLSAAQFPATASDENGQATMALAQLDTPKPKTPAAQNERCANYAKSAVFDYLTMRRFNACLLRDNARWQPNYQTHYQWCLDAQPEWPANEADARDTFLIKCGVRHKI